MENTHDIHWIVSRGILALTIVCALSSVIDNRNISFMLLSLTFITIVAKMCYNGFGKEE